MKFNCYYCEHYDCPRCGRDIFTTKDSCPYGVKLLSLEIEFERKKYKLVDIGNNSCKGCAFEKDNSACVRANPERLCRLLSDTTIWKEVK